MAELTTVRAHMATIRAFLQRWSKWWVALGVFMAIIIVPPAMLLILHAGGVNVSATLDPMGIALTLAALMGAIFVVGGLVVALAALVTLLSIEERIERTARAIVEERIEALLKDIAETQRAVAAEMGLALAMDPPQRVADAADE